MVKTAIKDSGMMAIPKYGVSFVFESGPQDQKKKKKRFM
jgi:hypothetical protein